MAEYMNLAPLDKKKMSFRLYFTLHSELHLSVRTKEQMILKSLLSRKTRINVIRKYKQIAYIKFQSVHFAILLTFSSRA